VQRAGSGSAQEVDTVVHSYVSLTDFNRDGRPDLLIAGGAPWLASSSNRTWSVFLNHGRGFDLTTPMTIASPVNMRGDLEPASASKAIAQIGAAGTACPTNFCPLNVPYPMIRSTRTVGNVGMSRDSNETHAAFLDIDADGSTDIVRRIHVLKPDGTKTEGLLIWRRPETGPQDLMIEERVPLEGRRELVEYKPASAFQWDDAMPTGGAPRLGHQPTVGLPGRLVRSVMSEKQLGRAEQRTRRGYDYKLPQFDMATRAPLGFSMRSSVPLDPASGAPIGESIEKVERSAQRPNAVPGVTLTRSVVRGTGAPVGESLVSYAEARTSGGGVGGLQSVLSAPTRTLTIEYPSGLTRGAIFEVSFDGRTPFRDRVVGREPRAMTPPTLSPTSPTGGAALFAARSGASLTYMTPHATPGSIPSVLTEATLELWLKPGAFSGALVIAEQTGAYRLLISDGAASPPQLSLEVTGNAPIVGAPSEGLSVDRWMHVIATFGGGSGRVFVNGVEVGKATVSNSPLPSGDFFIGSANTAAGRAASFFTGEIGEVRVYPEAWKDPPRVTDLETQLQLTNVTAPDFGQPLRVLSRNDLARGDDDVVKEFRYAQPVGASSIRGVVSSEAQRELKPDGTSGTFLTFRTIEYDGLPFGQVFAANETRSSQFDGMPQSTQPTSLRVITRKRYEDLNCPGVVTRTIDPLGAVSERTLDETCAFSVQEKNALGHVSRKEYYGINFPPARGMRGHYGEVAQITDANGASTLTTYDAWGRPTDVWGPLDRRDRPGLRFEYDDASCVETILAGSGGGGETPQDVETSCASPLAHTLYKPARTTSYVWDDQLRRCRDAKDMIVPCTSPHALRFADETATGAYRVSYAFGDGQVHNQVARDGVAAWTVTGIVDFDNQGRLSRRYRTQYIPTQTTATASGCPSADVWCDSNRLRGDPLRQVAAVQTAYDAQSRMVRSYGQGVPRCEDPSSLDATGAIACDAVAAQAANAAVTRLQYPAPGVLRTIDAHGVPSITYRDTRGLIVRNEDYLKNVATPYAYVQSTFDALERLVTVRDQDGHTATSDYDALSRITATSDPDMGRTTYRYDLRSQILERIVASGEKTTHVYDPLGRVTQTDFLLPKAAPSLPECCTLPGDRPPVVVPEFCYTVPGLPEPPHFFPVSFDSRRTLVLESLSREGNVGKLSLPFAMMLGDTSLKAGTPLSVGADGTITFGDDRTRLNVFPAELTLAENGLRYGVTGSKDDRRLTLEWEGTLGSRPDSRVFIRVMLAEYGAPVSLEYVHVPSDIDVAPSMTFQNRRGVPVTVRPYTPDGSTWAAGSGLALSMDSPSDGRGIWLTCNRPRGTIDWPINVPSTGDLRLRLQFRLFSSGGSLRVGYRDPRAPNVVHTLGHPGFTPRPMDEESIDKETIDTAADRAEFLLPAELRGQKVKLVLEHELTTNADGNGFQLHIPNVSISQTVYEPEERVLRVYDSSEAPYYIQSRATGGSVEAPPVIDLTFDVAGTPRDRSPTQAPFTCFGPNEDVLGASGRALGLPPASSCWTNAVPSTFSQFTTQFWLRPRLYPTITHALLQLDANTPGVAVRLEPDGRISCGGIGGGGVTSSHALPTDAWSHVALVYDGAELRCSVNGVVQGRGPMALLPRYTSLSLNGAGVGVDFDEVRIISGARSEAEVLADALRPLEHGVPRGNLVHIDFSLPASPGTDRSQARNDATLNGGEVIPGVQGQVFDAQSNGQVSIAHSNTLHLANQLSAELWMKTRMWQQGPARLIGKWATVGPGWRLELENGSGRLLWEVITNAAPPGAPPQIRRAAFVSLEQVNDDRWHHVAATYDGQRLRVFIDGIPAHRWCSGESQSTPNDCEEPPPPDPCAVEIRVPPEIQGSKPLGDAICINGTIDNTEPVLAARDSQQAQFNGLTDELRISNYAKREYEIAASARLASSFTQSLGRETLLRNQLPVGPELSNQVSREARAYDLRGRAASTLKYVRGQRSSNEFLTRSSPDALERNAAIEYPHGEVLLTGYDLGGVANSLVGYGPGVSTGAQQSQLYVANATTTVTGRPATLTYGNGVQMAWNYEDGPTPAGAFAAENLKASEVKDASGATLSSRQYDWDLLGNLKLLNDTPQKYEGNYHYDDLRRVTSATLDLAGTKSTFAYAYDALGNLTDKEGIKQDYGRAHLAAVCPSAAGVIPHAITRRGVPRDRYCYDEAGRLIQSSSTATNSIRYHRYFARGKLRSVTDRNGESRYSYDGNGMRVRKSEIDATGVRIDQTVPAALFRERPGGLEALYPLGGQTIARRLLDTSGASELAWFSDDHLGGSNLLTDASGQEIFVARAHYRPYGQFANGTPQIAAAGPRQFTGKELDLTGLYDFSARIYDPETGRFTQPDEAQPGVGTQAQNRYSYALNNPLAMIDPSGHDALAASGNRCSGCLLREVYAEAAQEELAARLKNQIDEDFRTRRVESNYAVPMKHLMRGDPGPQLRANYAELHGVYVFGGMADQMMLQSLQGPALAAGATFLTGSAFVGGAILTTLDGLSLGQAILSQDPLSISLAAAGLLMDVHGFSSKGLGLSATEHAEWARARASELGRELIALQDGVDWGNRTFAAGAFRDPVTGNVYNLVAANGYGGLNRGMRALSGELVIRGGGRLHAETRLLHFAAENGLKPIAIGASRAHCIVCADLNTFMGGINASALRPFSWAKGSLISTFGD
jgi:RHS repeat-associated protein